MKKLTALLLTVVAFASLLTGCGSGSKKNVETVKIWTSNSHSFGKELNYINNYNKTDGKKKGIYIDYILKAYNLYEELEKAVATDNAPQFSSWANMEYQVESGNIVPINDLPGGEQLLSMHLEKGLEYAPYTIYGEKVYALPTGIGTQGLVYNKSMFKEAGLVDENGEVIPPETIDEMRQYAKMLTNSKKGEYGIILPMAWDKVKAYKGGDSNSLWFSQDILSLAVASVGVDRYKHTQGFAQAFEPYLEIVLGMKEDGSIYPGAENMTNESARAIFSGGDVGMKISSTFDVAVFNYQFPVVDDWGVAPLPVLNKGERHRQLSSYNCTGMISSSALKKVTPEKLTEVLKVFISDDYKIMMYEEGLQLPYGLDISNVSTENMPKGWSEFAKIAENTIIFEGGLLASNEDFPRIFVNDVYLGGKNLSETAKKHDEAILEEWRQMDIEKEKENN